MKKYLPLLLTLSLLIISSCASFDLVNDYSMKFDKVKVEFDGKPFDIFDNTERSSAFVSESVLANFADAFVGGLTLTIVDASASVIKFEGAMQNYLDKYKEKDCKIIRSNPVEDYLRRNMGFEIFYDCK